ncbi:MAG: Pvc16 family protein [Myxococcota bacterium]
MITTNRPLAPGTERGPMQGVDLIGEVTEALHRHLMDNWEFDRAPPRIEEDLSFVPKDREEVVYIYMYKAVQNTALMNSKRFRGAKFNKPELGRVFYERAPLYLDLFYLIAVHSKFRSDAERLLGFVLLAMHESTHLLYRPRRYILPGGDVVNSKGDPWSAEYADDDEDLIIEKVSLALEDDMSIGDAINFFTIHEAPYRPYLTYSARCAMEGSLVAADATTVRSAGAAPMGRESGNARPSGRLPAKEPGGKPSGRFKTPFGPQGHNPRRIDDESSSESEE